MSNSNFTANDPTKDYLHVSKRVLPLFSAFKQYKNTSFLKNLMPPKGTGTPHFPNDTTASVLNAQTIYTYIHHKIKQHFPN